VAKPGASPTWSTAQNNGSLQTEPFLTKPLSKRFRFFLDFVMTWFVRKELIDFFCESCANRGSSVRTLN